MKCEHGDCFTCPYEDCIVGEKDPLRKKKYDAAWYRSHVKEVSIRNAAHYQAHKEELRLKRKLKKMKACFKCGKAFTEPGYYPFYKGRYFCCEDCLKDYFLEKILDNYEEEWIDTEENLRIAAEEAKNEW